MEALVTSIAQLNKRLSAKICGHNSVVQDTILALITNGHVLLESMPSTATIRAIKI